ncbi:MAG: anti-sigma factor family protein [Anaerolineae bacterium]
MHLIKAMHLSNDQMSAYVNGQLTAEQKAGVDAHLAVCPTCRARVEAHEGLSRDLAFALGSLPEPRATSVDRWWSALRQRPVRTPLRLAMIAPFAVSVMLLLIPVFAAPVVSVPSAPAVTAGVVTHRQSVTVVSTTSPEMVVAEPVPQKPETP